MADQPDFNWICDRELMLYDVEAVDLEPGFRDFAALFHSEEGQRLRHAVHVRNACRNNDDPDAQRVADHLDSVGAAGDMHLVIALTALMKPPRRRGRPSRMNMQTRDAVAALRARVANGGVPTAEARDIARRLQVPPSQEKAKADHWVSLLKGDG